jgi:ATP-dependent RNA helicase RhlE
LDIADLPYVVNYELPNVPEDYVHRIGRTGRAGKAGHAVSLVSDDEEAYLWAIEKSMQQAIPLFKLDAQGEKIALPPIEKPRGQAAPKRGQKSRGRARGAPSGKSRQQASSRRSLGPGRGRNTRRSPSS